MAYQTALAFHQHFLSGLCSNCSFLKSLLHVTENNKLLFKALWLFMAKRSSYVKGALIPLLPGASERVLGGVCIYQLLFMLPPPLYVCFCTRTSCCIAIIPFLGIVNNQLFKFGVTTLCASFGK
jgi:hypothetical protein